MPPPPGQGAKKKKKGKAPKHQNSFAFRHNPKSKKTDKILASPNVGACRRCHEKIEWRKKYRKYKPRTQLGKCNLCFQKNITAAYHTICTKCATSDKAIAAMEKRRGGGGGGGGASESTPDGEEAKPEKKTSKRRIRVCAVCASEPAMSKYSDAHGEDGDVVEQIHELEDVLESGIHEDGHKLTLRETKGVERKIEKLQLELRRRRTKRNNAEQEQEEEEEMGGAQREGGNEVENDDASNPGSSVGERDDDPAREEEEEEEEEEDPFLLATGGKALVGDDYQRMLLAREQRPA